MVEHYSMVQLVDLTDAAHEFDDVELEVLDQLVILHETQTRVQQWSPCNEWRQVSIATS